MRTTQPKSESYRQIEAKLMQAICLLAPWLPQVENEIERSDVSNGQMAQLEHPELFAALSQEAVEEVEKPGTDTRCWASKRCMASYSREAAIRRIAALVLVDGVLGSLATSIEYRQCEGYVANKYKYQAYATKVRAGRAVGGEWTVSVYRGSGISRPHGKGSPWGFKITLSPEAAKVLGRKTLSA